MADTQKTFNLIIKATADGVAKVTQGLQTDFQKSGKAMSAFNKIAGNGKRAVGLLTNEIKLLVATTLSYQTAVKAVTAVSGFDQKFTEVTTLTNASAQSLGLLRDEIIKISTEIPQTAGELTTATYDIISAGVALEDSSAVLELSAKAAIAGVTDTQTAVNAGVGVMNAYGLEVDSLEGIYDTLFQTVKLGVVTFPELASNIGKVAPIARGAGVDFSSLSAAVATLTKSGITADIATTGLRGAIAALSTPTPEAKKAMADLGISWTTLEGTIKQIVDANLGSVALRQIVPDIQARLAVSSLRDNYQTLVTTLGEMGEAAGSTEVAYDKMAKTLVNRFQLIKNTFVAAILQNDDFGASLDAILIQLKEAAPAISELVTSVITFVSNLVLWTAENRSLVKTILGAGGLFIAFSKIVSVIQGLSIAVGAFKAAGLATAVTTASTAVGTTTSVGLVKSVLLLGTNLGYANVITRTLTQSLGAIGLAGAVYYLGSAFIEAVKEYLVWSAEMERGNEILDQQIILNEAHAEKLAAIGAALGITIADQKEYNELMEVGAIVRNESTGLLELNYEAYIKYHAGLLTVEDAETKVAGAVGKTAVEMVAAATAQNIAQIALDEFIAGLPKVSDGVESYAIKVADLKLALAESKKTQEEFNQQMLVLNQKHWTDEVEILT
ncbi:phage tail tape measure protein, partial [bacterium]|nr:phage tail tape measure protein [bacterium]